MSGNVYDGACGEHDSLLVTCDTLADIIGFEQRPVFASSRNGDIQHSLADITRARRDLGYEPKVGFREGLHRTIAWYAANLRNDVRLDQVAV